jgi:hypothetical protein
MIEISKLHVTAFTDCFSNDPMIIPLKKWLSSCKTPVRMQKVETIKQIRAIPDKEQRRRLKTQLPVVCVGAILKNRKEILELTGLMQFDIDPQDNPMIKDWQAQRDSISAMDEIVYCGLSASGQGVWGIIKVKNITKYKEHFECLRKDFNSIGIVLDPSKGGNPTDLRFYSYDPDSYIADEFATYCKLLPPKPKVNHHRSNFIATSSTDLDKFGTALRYCEKKGLKLIDGQKHNYLLLFARICELQGLSKREVETFIDNNLISLNQIKSNCIDYPYRNKR